jgi:hypothetical protein
MQLIKVPEQTHTLVFGIHITQFNFYEINV